jgi:hypothetical protein
MYSYRGKPKTRNRISIFLTSNNVFMKKSQFFLTVTTFCLAIAAVASTKANGRFAIRGYTEDPATHTCTVDSGLDCAGPGVNCLDGNGAQLFVKDNVSGCTVQLKKAIF